MLVDVMGVVGMTGVDVSGCSGVAASGVLVARFACMGVFTFAWLVAVGVVMSANGLRCSGVLVVATGTRLLLVAMGFASGGGTNGVCTVVGREGPVGMSLPSTASPAVGVLVGKALTVSDKGASVPLVALVVVCRRGSGLVELPAACGV